MEHRGLFTLLHAVIWLLLSKTCYGTERDIRCLKRVKESLIDTNNILRYSWDFNRSVEGEGFICEFSGVECWHPDESSVLNLRLSNMGLQGQFPLGLEDCTSMIGLKLSNNNLSGPIPSDISKRVSFVTTLDLSYNFFSGEIPLNMANCTYLNVLNLQHNRLQGNIPPSLGQLNRLTLFNVADNSLSGPVPHFVNPNISTNFANNDGLCGTDSLGPCTGAKKKSNTGVIIGSAVGGVIFTTIIVAIILIICLRRIAVKK